MSNKIYYRKLKRKEYAAIRRSISNIYRAAAIQLFLIKQLRFILETLQFL